MWRRIGRLARDARGGTAIEYGLVLALIVLAIMAALLLFATRSMDLWTNVSTKVVAASQ